MLPLLEYLHQANNFFKEVINFMLILYLCVYFLFLILNYGEYLLVKNILPLIFYLIFDELFYSLISILNLLILSIIAYISRFLYRTITSYHIILLIYIKALLVISFLIQVPPYPAFSCSDHFYLFIYLYFILPFLTFLINHSLDNFWLSLN